MAINGRNILIGTMSGQTFTAFAAVKSHEAQSQCEAIERSSATQQEWKEFIAGRKEWSVSVNGLVLENAASNIEDLMKIGTVYDIRIKDRDGNYSVSGKALCVQCKQSYQTGILSIGSYSLKGTGPLRGHSSQ